MVFANLIFIYIFLPLNLLLYFVTKNKAWRNAVLIAFSLFFYAWGEPIWITLMLFSAIIDYCHGRIIENHRGQWQAKAAVASSLILNLGLLATFKYSGFIVENVNALLRTDFGVPSFGLPIGISFYTFQTISYTIDVYRGEVSAQKNFSKFLMYVSSYHQLVAGPIVRYSDVAKEIENRQTTAKDFSEGITKFCIGLAKKVMVANVAGQMVSRYLDGDLTKLSVTGAWFGVLMFSIQLYYDFSGYSDMAIGLGRIFGFHYPTNFNYPYISKSVTEFWRRWHMTLGSFFRDYVYIPLGGNRKHQWLNIAVVWFLTGLWHGASWNFILWGVYYGVLLMIEKLFLLKWLKKIPSVFAHAYALLAAVIGWAIFYVTDMERLRYLLSIMFGFSGAALSDLQLTITLQNNIFWLIAAAVFCIPVTQWVKGKVDALPDDKQALCHSCAAVMNAGILFICTAMLVGQSYNPFLYFRF